MSDKKENVLGFIPLDAELVGESPEGASPALMQIAKAGSVRMEEVRTVAEMAPLGLNNGHDSVTMLAEASAIAVESMNRTQLTRLIRQLRRDGCPIEATQRGEKNADLRARIIHWAGVPRQVPVIKAHDENAGVGIEPLTIAAVVKLGQLGVLGERPGHVLNIEVERGSGIHHRVIIEEGTRTKTHQREWIQTVNDTGRHGARRADQIAVEMTSRKRRGHITTVPRFGCNKNAAFLLDGNKAPKCVSKATGIEGWAKEGRTTCQVCGGPAEIEIHRAGGSRINATFKPMLAIKPDGRFVRRRNETAQVKVVYTHQQKKSRRHQFKIDGKPRWVHGTAMRVEAPLAPEAQAVFNGETIPVWCFVATGEKSGDYDPMALNVAEERMLRTLLNVARKSKNADYLNMESKIIRKHINTGAV